MTQTPHILMCPPTYFGVEYVINPWMEGNVGGADRPKAARQWDGLHQLLSDRTQVALVEPAEGLPDMCFVANAGLRLSDRFVPSVFRVPQRAAEVPHFVRWFAEAGDRIESIPEDRAFEGEGDALPALLVGIEDALFHPGRALLWAGYGVRSSLLSHWDLNRLFRIEVASLRLTDERFYHLDTCFCPLPDGAAMYHPAAFDDRSLKLIHQKIPEDRRIEVSEADALGFCCNAVRVGRTLIAHHGSLELKKKLARLDFELITTPLDQFLKAGGGAKCLTLLLRQDLEAPGPDSEAADSLIRTSRVQLAGHLLDSGLINRALDAVTDAGGSFRIEQFRAGLRRDQPSQVHLRISSPDETQHEQILNELHGLGAAVVDETTDARWQPAPADGVAPEGFYSTTIYPTEVRLDGRWVKASAQRMDAVLVLDLDKQPPEAACRLMRNLKKDQPVVTGVEGVAVHAPETHKAQEANGRTRAQTGISS